MQKHVYNDTTGAEFGSSLIIHIASGIQRFKTFEAVKHLSRVTWRFVFIVIAEKTVQTEYLNYTIGFNLWLGQNTALFSGKNTKKNPFKVFLIILYYFKCNLQIYTREQHVFLSPICVYIHNNDWLFLINTYTYIY